MESQEVAKNSVIEKLRVWDAPAVAEVIEFRGEWTVVLRPADLIRVATYLATEPSLNFSFLSDVTAVDRFPMEPRFEVY